jgi:hypothetical protein
VLVLSDAAVAVLFTTAFVVVVVAAATVVVVAATVVVVAATVVVVTSAAATVVVVAAATVVVVAATVVLVELEDDDEEGDVAVASYRATANDGGPDALLCPATTIFESPCIAIAFPASNVPVPMSVVTLPSVSREVSSAPSVL